MKEAPRIAGCPGPSFFGIHYIIRNSRDLGGTVGRRPKSFERSNDGHGSPAGSLKKHVRLTQESRSAQVKRDQPYLPYNAHDVVNREREFARTAAQSRRRIRGRIAKTRI